MLYRQYPRFHLGLFTFDAFSVAPSVKSILLVIEVVEEGVEAGDGFGVGEVVGAEFFADFFEGEFHNFDFFVPFGLGFGFGEIEGEEDVDFFGEESDGGVDESGGDHGYGFVADFFDEFGAASVFGRFVAFEFACGDFEDGFLDGDSVLLREED